MKPIALNLVIAGIWLFLSRQPSLAVFAVGFFVGFAVIALFRHVIDDEGYVRRCVAFVRFLLIFIREFLVANFTVAWTVLFTRKDALYPNFLTYDVSGLTRIEILLLSYSLSLTPGTTTVQIEGDFNTLILHVLNADQPDKVRASIDRRLKSAILKFTR
jgi:multisubunit Na+/H+ antiporter MnhE subunit